MSGLPHAGSFRELVVYQKACHVAQKIFDLAKSFPREETYALTDQVRHASRSISEQVVLNGMMEKSYMFCGQCTSTVREDLALYFRRDD